MLSDDGFLMLGTTENLYGIDVSFVSNHDSKAVYYTKVNSSKKLHRDIV